MQKYVDNQWSSIEGANYDLSNLTPLGEKHFLNKSQVTNCILENPYKVLFEMGTKGEIIFKTGTSLIVPAGLDENNNKKFDFITLSEDVTLIPEGSGTNCLILLGTSPLHAGSILSIQSYSGPTAPVYSHNTALWYDTSENIIKYSNNNGATWKSAGYTFPIAMSSLSTINNGLTWQYPAALFEFAGCIGNTFWIRENLKVLIPNGRNEDGTFKNLEVNTSLYIHEIAYEESMNSDTEATLIIYKDSPESETKESWFGKLTQGEYWQKPAANFNWRYYDSNQNFWKITGNGNSYENKYVCPIADFHLNTARQITTFKPYPILQVNTGRNNAQVVDSFSVGNKWARVWSDGFIENGEWGITGNTGTISNFLVPYNKTYSVFAMDTGNGHQICGCSKTTLTYFTWNVSNQVLLSWYAQGY